MVRIALVGSCFQLSFYPITPVTYITIRLRYVQPTKSSEQTKIRVYQIPKSSHDGSSDWESYMKTILALDKRNQSSRSLVKINRADLNDSLEGKRT